MSTQTESSPELGSSRFFRDEVIRFRELCGMKSFWQDVEKAGRAMKGLLYVYANTTEDLNQNMILMQATSEEYDRRLLWALLRK